VAPDRTVRWIVTARAVFASQPLAAGRSASLESHPGPAGGFVGREHELTELLGGLDDARPERARRLLGLVLEAPAPVWGRDEFGAGEMWHSNSLVSWLIPRTGLDVCSIQPRPGGRAPRW
jgi:hypothetical protein